MTIYSDTLNIEHAFHWPYYRTWPLYQNDHFTEFSRFTVTFVTSVACRQGTLAPPKPGPAFGDLFSSLASTIIWSVITEWLRWLDFYYPGTQW